MQKVPASVSSMSSWKSQSEGAVKAWDTSESSCLPEQWSCGLMEYNKAALYVQNAGLCRAFSLIIQQTWSPQIWTRQSRNTFPPIDVGDVVSLLFTCWCLLYNLYLPMFLIVLLSKVNTSYPCIWPQQDWATVRHQICTFSLKGKNHVRMQDK